MPMGMIECIESVCNTPELKGVLYGATHYHVVALASNDLYDTPAEDPLVNYGILNVHTGKYEQYVTGLPVAIRMAEQMSKAMDEVIKEFDSGSADVLAIVE